eukprot:TRINITY_DN13336_c0_g1_i1.p1 TRINITY_DN13336_c0_g1~~TRINITY_DN13336_c0_g1_i1.p1  ORF type:complete len:218 (-),score=0.37 TRINITY_DN13336_c0_g1_i1:48-665(-)
MKSVFLFAILCIGSIVAQCDLYKASCLSCTSQPSCNWCPSSGECVPTSTYCSSGPAYTSCSLDFNGCSQKSVNCETCNGPCEWCSGAGSAVSGICSPLGVCSPSDTMNSCDTSVGLSGLIIFAIVFPLGVCFLFFLVLICVLVRVRRHRRLHQPSHNVVYVQGQPAMASPSAPPTYIQPATPPAYTEPVKQSYPSAPPAYNPEFH